MTIITKGATNQSVYLRIIDDTDGTPETGVVYNTAGIDLWYFRPGAVHTSITEATTTEGAAHTDGGFIHISDGVYKLDVPDAAFATGVDHVIIGGTVTDMIVISERVELVDVDFRDAVRGGMTALPNAAADAAGGLPISDAGGLDLDAMNTNINDIETDTAEIGAAGAGLTDLGGMSTAMKAEVNTEVDSAFTTTMADSVATDGSIATREQALYQVLQFLTEKTVSGTTVTVRKVDGSTSLFTCELDSSTTPTDISRS